MGTDELLDAVRRYAMERFPRASSIEIRINVPQGEGAKFCVPIYCGQAGRQTVLETGASASSAPKITRTERRTLKTIEGMDEEAPTGEEVAAAAKLPYEPHFRKMMAAMRVKGLLGGAEGEPGYPITTLGLEVIEPVGDGA